MQTSRLAISVFVCVVVLPSPEVPIFSSPQYGYLYRSVFLLRDWPIASPRSHQDLLWPHTFITIGKILKGRRPIDGGNYREKHLRREIVHLRQ